MGPEISRSLLLAPGWEWAIGKCDEEAEAWRGEEDGEELEVSLALESCSTAEEE